MMIFWKHCSFHALIPTTVLAEVALADEAVQHLQEYFDLSGYPKQVPDQFLTDCPSMWGKWEATIRRAMAKAVVGLGLGRTEAPATMAVAKVQPFGSRDNRPVIQNETKSDSPSTNRDKSVKGNKKKMREPRELKK